MSPDSNSAKRPSPDDNEQLSKKLRTGEVVVDKDLPGPTESVNALDYSHGVLSPSSSPFFSDLRETLGPYLVDKTKLIEKIISHNSLKGRADLVLRPRRCGKSTMLQMIKSFFGITEKVDARRLFSGLYIASQRELCVKHMGKYPVLFLDFKNLVGQTWEEMFWSFKQMVSELYKQWYEYLRPCLNQAEQAEFESIRDKLAPEMHWMHSLKDLSTFLARQSKQRVIVLIDEYDAPLNLSYEHDFFPKSNQFFGRLVLPALLKTNENLAYALLAGVTPVAKNGWYSGLNNLEIHALHRSKSIFAGMLMFTEDEVLKLRTSLNCDLDPGELKAHYHAYLAGGHTSVYNPVSIMSAFQQSEIENFWVNTGEYPLLDRKLPDDAETIVTIERLLSKEEVSFQLQKSVTFSISMSDRDGMLTLLYYAGYLTMTPDGHFKIPNREVMIDWARWVIGKIYGAEDIIERCVGGPVTAFATKWPNFLENSLDPKTVANSRGAISSKTPERIYQIFLYGLLHALRPKGWEVNIESRAGSGYIDIRLVSKQKQSATLIELKSSETKGQIEGDADKALEQIIQKNYRNTHLPGICILREYGIASYHLKSFVKGRYLELNGRGEWVEKDDPVSSTLST